jgi:hypothetical protein
VFSTHLRIVNFVPYSIYWSVFITDMESVYCAVRYGSSNKTDYVSSLNWSVAYWSCIVQDDDCVTILHIFPQSEVAEVFDTAYTTLCKLPVLLYVDRQAVMTPAGLFIYWLYNVTDFVVQII